MPEMMARNYTTSADTTATCNRVRLTVDGVLHLCLGQEDRTELRPLPRSGASDATIIAVLRQAID